MEIRKLGFIGHFSKGLGISKGEAHSGNIPCVRYGEIYTRHNDYVKIFYSHISSEVAANSRQLKAGDLLFAGSGETKEEIGKCVAFISKCEAYAGGDIVILSPEVEVDSLFLGYYLNSKPISAQKASYGQGDAIVHISASSLAEIELQLPPLSEQRRIAAALSDTDDCISALEKLIAKKRLIKQGAMQELLTGKRRLPGFEDEWGTDTWQDVLDVFSSGATPYRGNPEYYKGSIKWVSSGELKYNVIYDTHEHISYSAQMDASLTMHPPGTFLMAITGLEAAGTRGSCALLGTEATTNQSCMAIYGTDKMSTKYLYHYYILFGDSLAFQYCQGTKQQSYTAKIVKALPILYPVDIKEQTAIAAILSDMDAEIDVLTAKLNKLMDIKQGMMSELLTGRIRLIDEDTMNASATTAIEAPKQASEHISMQPVGHNQPFDDAVMIAGIVNTLYSENFPLGRKKVQKCLYLLRRHQDESTAAFKKKAAGPYADEVRYKGGEPIAENAKYITTSTNIKGTTFAPGAQIEQALGYIDNWDKQDDIKWVADKLRYKKVDELELLATVDMAICDLGDAGTPVSVSSIKHLIETNEEWKAKLKKQAFSDENIVRAIQELPTLLQGGN